MRGCCRRGNSEPNCSYTACLLPAFELGRRSGLGEEVADTDDGSVRSWSGPADAFPIYFEWSFRTGVGGDFEALVRALVPRDMDPRVGIRDPTSRIRASAWTP